MRRMAWMIPAVALAAAVPVAGWAEDVVIRLEAKRTAEAAAEAAARYAARFEDVVTLELPGGWTGIAIGPLPREDAVARLAELKAERAVPSDAFVSAPPSSTVLVPAGQVAQAAEEVTSPVADDAEAEEAPAAEMAEAGATEAEVTEEEVSKPDAAELEPAEPEVAEPEAPALPEGSFLRLEAFQDQAEARTALARWSEEFGSAWLWELPDGWYAVAIGPIPAEAASAWLPALKTAEVVPSDALATEAAALGAPVEEGAAPDGLEAPGEAQPLPPLDEVQRALRWAGHYDGEIDGKDGPMTQAAIRAQIASARASTDPGTALRLLIEHRNAWRAELDLRELRDEPTGLQVTAPMQALAFDRAERALSIYGPADDSGAAMILFSQPGGQQELMDLAGLVTALGWVPQPERMIAPGHVRLHGANEAHVATAEGWVRDGRAEGFVLIWPASDPETQRRVAAEISDSLTRFAEAGEDAEAPALPVTP